LLRKSDEEVMKDTDSKEIAIFGVVFTIIVVGDGFGDGFGVFSGGFGI
jgi:hypothetical protein